MTKKIKKIFQTDNIFAYDVDLQESHIESFDENKVLEYRFTPFCINIILNKEYFERLFVAKDKDYVTKGLHLKGTFFNVIRENQNKLEIEETIIHEEIHSLLDIYLYQFREGGDLEMEEYQDIDITEIENEIFKEEKNKKYRYNIYNIISHLRNLKLTISKILGSDITNVPLSLVKLSLNSMERKKKRIIEYFEDKNNFLDDLWEEIISELSELFLSSKWKNLKTEDFNLKSVLSFARETLKKIEQEFSEIDSGKKLIEQNKFLSKENKNELVNSLDEIQEVYQDFNSKIRHSLDSLIRKILVILMISKMLNEQELRNSYYMFFLFKPTKYHKILDYLRFKYKERFNEALFIVNMKILSNLNLPKTSSNENSLT